MRRRWLLLYPFTVLACLFAWFLVALPAREGQAVLGGLALPPAVGGTLYLAGVPAALVALGLWQWLTYLRRVPPDRVVSGALFLLSGVITLGLFLTFARWADSHWQASATQAALINGVKKIQGEVDNRLAAGKPLPVRDGTVDLAALLGTAACPENKDRHGHELFPTPCPWQVRIGPDGKTVFLANQAELVRTNPHLEDFTRLPGAPAVILTWVAVWLGLGANFNLWAHRLAGGPPAAPGRLPVAPARTVAR